jgi:hypothetical protein
MRLTYSLSKRLKQSWRKIAMPTEKNINKPEFQINNALPSLFIDGVSISNRKDNIFLVRLLTHLPDGSSEQSRFFITKDRFCSILNTMCESANHYPIKKRVVKKDKSQVSA